MKRFYSVRLGLIGVLTVTQIAFLFITMASAATSTLATSGKITGISRKAKTVSIAQKDGGYFTAIFNDKTKYKNAKSYKSLKVKDAIKVKYKKVKSENIAILIERALAKLPAGVTEIKTKELSQLLAANQSFKLIDARPVAMFEQSHIPGAISIPFSKLKKVGKKLLPFPKNELLVFYCGGDT